MIPASLGDRFAPARVAIEVTLHQPLPCGRHQVVTGQLLGVMHARDCIHHYRVAVGQGVVYLAPPDWVVLLTHDEAHVGSCPANETGASA